MDQQTIELVQHSWKKVAAIAPQAAALFYQNLFAADPDLRPLFKNDLGEQGNKLMQTLSIAVAKLNDLDSLAPVLQDLARRHVGYGVQEEHYATVGSALLQTLEQGLGDDFTPPVKAAWSAVYGVVADVMITAAKSAEPVR
jgi:hemoglobin-like flavoprotein